MRLLLPISVITAASFLLVACGNGGPVHQLTVKPAGQRYGVICTRMGSEAQNFAVTQVERENLTGEYVEEFSGSSLDCIVSIEGGNHDAELVATMTSDGKEVAKINFGEGYVGGMLDSGGQSSLIEATEANTGPSMPVGFSETRAVSACDEAVKASMVSPTSFRTRGMWEWTQGPDAGQATFMRNFTARNAMNAELSSRYRCIVDAKNYRVVSIRTEN